MPRLVAVLLMLASLGAQADLRDLIPESTLKQIAS